VVNAAECEPYITVDYRECIENSANILDGVYKLKSLLDIKYVIIAVEDNKPAAFAALKRIAESERDYDNSVKLMVLKSRYPQGAEKNDGACHNRQEGFRPASCPQMLAVLL
jgi:electron transport complex protein RnfC